MVDNRWWSIIGCVYAIYNVHMCVYVLVCWGRPGYEAIACTCVCVCVCMCWGRPGYEAIACTCVCVCVCAGGGLGMRL